MASKGMDESFYDGYGPISLDQDKKTKNMMKKYVTLLQQARQISKMSDFPDRGVGCPSKKRCPKCSSWYNGQCMDMYEYGVINIVVSDLVKQADEILKKLIDAKALGR